MDLKTISSNIKQRVISAFGDTDIFMEAMKRGNSGRLSKTIKPSAKSSRMQDVEMWKRAVATAMNPENPNRNPLYDIYDVIENDLHLEGVIETRIQKLLRSKFRIVNDKTGETNEELTDLFRRPWFEEFLRIASKVTFKGTKVVELFDMVEDEFTTVDEINPRHVKPELGIIVEEESDEKGWNYLDPKFKPYYMQIGKPKELGLLKKIAPTALAKIYALGALSLFIEKYGVPYFWLQTDSTDDKRMDELADIMASLGPAGWGIFSSEEKLESVMADGNGEVMEKMRSICNSEISIVILGQDGTTNHADSNGTYGSLKVLTEVANDRHESDKANAENLVNFSLIPLMKTRSSLYARLEGHRFEWDDFEELDQKDFIESVVKLSSIYELDPEQITAKTGINILGLKKTTVPGGEFAKKQ